MKFKLASVLVCTALLSGCAAQTFNINGKNGEIPTQQASQHFFISGLGQEQIIDAAEVCGGVNKVIKVEAQHTFVNGLLGLVTFGIYTPRDAKVYCKS
ncbi:Bor family protein [Parashewanella tropica]|uniref:Bor family protein n=1 Tax=Parashewanella tropica TaxID=2547970 RepID=UPI0010592C5C|nr:Bor family protein [Parashewanella tropica]